MERWCERFAASLLLPAKAVKAKYLVVGKSPIWVYRNEDFAPLVRGAAINLGFTHFRGESGTSLERRQVRLREFEIPMAGGFYLTQDCPQLRELFNPGRDVACWDQLPDLLDKIAYYRERPAERQNFAEAARAHCLNHHTWQQRFSGLLDELGIDARA